VLRKGRINSIKTVLQGVRGVGEKMSRLKGGGGPPSTIWGDSLLRRLSFNGFRKAIVRVERGTVTSVVFRAVCGWTLWGCRVLRGGGAGPVSGLGERGGVGDAKCRRTEYSVMREEVRKIIPIQKKPLEGIVHVRSTHKARGTVLANILRGVI